MTEAGPGTPTSALVPGGAPRSSGRLALARPAVPLPGPRAPGLTFDDLSDLVARCRSPPTVQGSGRPSGTTTAPAAGPSSVIQNSPSAAESRHFAAPGSWSHGAPAPATRRDERTCREQGGRARKVREHEARRARRGRGTAGLASDRPLGERGLRPGASVEVGVPRPPSPASRARSARRPTRGATAPPRVPGRSCNVTATVTAAVTARR